MNIRAKVKILRRKYREQLPDTRVSIISQSTDAKENMSYLDFIKVKILVHH